MEETVHNELRSLSHIIYRFIENLPNKKKIESMTGTNGGILPRTAAMMFFKRTLKRPSG